MAFKKIGSLALVTLLIFSLITSSTFTSAAVQALPTDSYAYAGQVSSCEIDGSSVVLKGKVTSLNGSSTLNAYELPIYQDEKTANYTALTPIGTISTNTIPSSGSFSLTIDLSRIKSIASKFVIRLSNQKLMDSAKYITNPGILATNKDLYPTAKSIKGLQVQINSDAERLGVQHAAINITLNSMITLSNHGNASIPFTVGGKTYYFVREYIESLDATFAPLSGNHIVVNAIILLPGCDLNDTDTPNKDIVHPDAKSSMGDYIINAVNLTNQAGVDYYTAMMTFLSQRYNGSNRNYGTINGYIIGNEIGMRTYNNMGDKTIEEYSMQYERQLRLTSTIVKQARSSARVYVSLEHFWATTQYEYVNRDLVDLINYYSKKGGDYDWNIAFHPYPDDLEDPKTWNDTNTTDSINTVKINFKNLQVLPRYLKRTEMLYNGQSRRIILSEEGFNTPEPSSSYKSQQIQAAAYAYAYYKAVSIPEVDAFILHRHVDHTQEAGLKLGLWDTLEGQVVQPGNEKLIYMVFKDIDTVNSKKVTAFALDIISQNNTAKNSYTDWKQLIPEYSEATITAKCNRPAVAYPNDEVTGNVSGITKLGDSTFKEWYATDNTISPTVVHETTGDCLSAGLTGDSMKEYKGFTFQPTTALNFKTEPILMVDVKVTGLHTYTNILIRAYSKDRVFEYICPVKNIEKWITVCTDLSKFAGIESIDRIKVWVCPEDDMVWKSGSISIKNLAAASSATVQPTTSKPTIYPTGNTSETSGENTNTITSEINSTVDEPIQTVSTAALQTDPDVTSAIVSPRKNTFPLIPILGIGILLIVSGSVLFIIKKKR